MSNDQFRAMGRSMHSERNTSAKPRMAAESGKAWSFDLSKDSLFVAETVLICKLYHYLAIIHTQNARVCSEGNSCVGVAVFTDRIHQNLISNLECALQFKFVNYVGQTVGYNLASIGPIGCNDDCALETTTGWIGFLNEPRPR
jgi:hypothetical protein